MRMNFYRNTFGRNWLKMLLEQFCNFIWILIRNQTHWNFSKSFWGDHRFGTFSNVASPDSIDIKSGSNGCALNSTIPCFTISFRNSYGFTVGSFVERCTTHFIAFFCRNFHNIIIKTGNRNLIVFIFQRCDHLTKCIDRVGYRTTI